MPRSQPGTREVVFNARGSRTSSGCPSSSHCSQHCSVLQGWWQSHRGPQARLSGGCGRGLHPGWLCFGGLGVSSTARQDAMGNMWPGETSYVCTQSCFLSVGDVAGQGRNEHFHRLQDAHGAMGQPVQPHSHHSQTLTLTQQQPHPWLPQLPQPSRPSGHQLLATTSPHAALGCATVPKS